MYMRNDVLDTCMDLYMQYNDQTSMRLTIVIMKDYDLKIMQLRTLTYFSYIQLNELKIGLW
jgi:hypothetical protein